MASMLSPERPRPSVLATFLVLSLLVHLAVLAWLNRAQLSLGEAEPPPLVVKLAPPAEPAAPPSARAQQAPAPPGALARPAPPKQQIVAPSDTENNLAPAARAYLSDRDNRVEQETVKRGNPEAGAATADPPPEKPAETVARAEPPSAVPPSKPAAKAAAKPAPPRAAAPPRAPAQAAPRPPRVAARPTEQGPGDTESAGKPLPGLDQLLLPPAEVLAKADTRDAGPAGGEAPPTRAGADDPRRDLVSAPPPARGIFGGPRGTFDDLPDVAQGNLTLLNTKADRFAPFVRRVGTRVFQNLLIFQRRNLALNDILAAHEAITVRAVLDKSGKLKTMDVEDRSGSLAVDQTLLDALRQAAFDQNPPTSAANPNGEYEFIFQAQLAAAISPGPGQPQVRAIESRLRVGLL